MSAATLGIAVLVAVGPAALAQGAGGSEGGGIAEELRRIREQMTDIARANDALVWISIAVSAASILAMGLITLYLIRRQLAHMDKDARIKRRPILSCSKFENGMVYNMQKTDMGDALTIRLVNVGHIAALSIKYTIKTIKGNGVNPLDTEPCSIGSLAPNAHTEMPVMLFKKDHEFGRDGTHTLHVDLKYETIEKELLSVRLTVAYNNGQVGIMEEHGRKARLSSGKSPS